MANIGELWFGWYRIVDTSLGPTDQNHDQVISHLLSHHLFCVSRCDICDKCAMDFCDWWVNQTVFCHWL